MHSERSSACQTPVRSVRSVTFATTYEVPQNLKGMLVAFLSLAVVTFPALLFTKHPVVFAVFIALLGGCAYTYRRVDDSATKQAKALVHTMGVSAASRAMHNPSIDAHTRSKIGKVISQ